MKKNQKNLEEDSTYNKYDMDGDGIVTDEELEHAKEINRAEAELRKQRAQRRMATGSLIAMGAVTFLMFLPIIPLERVEALSDISNLFYISAAGIVGAYMGTSAWMSNRNK